MATTGNINPWAAGAVVFNTQPYAAFYERQMLRKQAKEDALDNYFKDLGKNVTSTGMRVQDVPVLMQKQKDWQQFYLQNKAAILNPKLDNGDAYSRYMSGFQDQLALTGESKSEAKKDQELAKLRFNPEAKHIFDDPHFLKEKELDNLPIGDPRRKRFDLMTAALPPKPIGLKELEAHNKYLTGGIKFDEIPGKTENIGGFKTRTPIYTQYSPENQMKIGTNAANEFDTDKTWRNEAVKFFDKISNDPVELDRYNNVFKSLYGSDIDSAREAWMAKGILDNNMKATKYEKGTDEVGLWKYKENLRTANDLYLAREKKKIDPNDTELNNSWLEGYWRNRIVPAKQGEPSSFPDPDSPVQMKVGWKIMPDGVMMKALSREGREPNAVYVTDKNQIYPLFYEYEDVYENGKKVGTGVKKDARGMPVLDKDYSQPMELEQAMVSTGYRTLSKGKNFNEVIGKIVNKGVDSGMSKPKQKSFTIDGKTVTRDELRKSHTDEEIDEYIKLGILK